MPARRDLPLEEKLKIPLSDMPLSEDVKMKLSRCRIHNLKDLVRRFHRNPGKINQPFFSYKSFAEAGYLVIRMGFDGSQEMSSGYLNFTSEGVWVRTVTDLDKGIKESIDRYVNEDVPYSGRPYL